MTPRGAGKRKREIATLAIHGSADQAGSDSIGVPLTPPIVQASTFAFETPEEMISVFEGKKPGYVYSRYGNPTLSIVEEKLAALEGGSYGLLFSSGLAAIHAVLWHGLKTGDRILTSRDLYGGTIDLMSRLLPRLGVEWIRVDINDEEEYQAALSEGPDLVYFETPTNPLLRIVDGARATALAHGVGARVAVDNTFATPILQNPIEWGADFVLHSATKYLGGHSDLVLGAVVGRGNDESGLERVRRDHGASADPFAAWLLNRGLATLAVRVRAQTATAEYLVERLARHPRVERAHYPGLDGDPGHAIATRQMRGYGGMFSLTLRDGREAAVALMSGLRLIRLATSLGGVETLVSHPATSSHRMLPPQEREDLGIREGTVRFSVGLEDREDLLADIEEALGEAGGEGR